MKKFFSVSLLIWLTLSPLFAGGILTNTNQHAAFLRMISRGASIGINGVYTNPAGVSFLPHNGLTMSFSVQSAFQTRNIDASYNTYAYRRDKIGVEPFNPQYIGSESVNEYYKGKASAPIIPSLYAAYRMDDLTLSAFFGVTGGGGKCSFDSGLPLFKSLVSALVFQQSSAAAAAGKSIPLNRDMYNITSAMDGRQYIYALQLGVGYKFNDWLAGFVGGKMNYFTGGYEGFVNAELLPNYGGTTLADIQLDCTQTGWGLTPVIGLDAKLNRWNFAVKYEFKTNLNIENKTKTLVAPDPSLLAPYADGVNTPSDIPAFLTIAAGYEVLPQWRVNAEFHHFDDKNAGMANDKQKALTHGTLEYQVGTEYDVNHFLTLSGGIQFTNYGLADNFQSDTSFYCDSYSIGLGAAVKLSSKALLNIGYMWTTYKDYTKSMDSYNNTGLPGTDIYSRTNKVFGVSLDYSF